MSIALKGVKAPTLVDRVAETPAAQVRFGHDTKARGIGVVPALIAEMRTFLDKNVKDVAPAATELAAVKNVAELEQLMKGALSKHQAYLDAAELAANKNEQMGVSNLRKVRLFEAVAKSLSSTAIPQAERASADATLRRLLEQTYTGKSHVFELAKHATYHPYSQPYSPGVEALERVVPEGLEREQVKKVLRYVMDRKTTSGGSSIAELNAEVSLRQRIIDHANGDQAVSLAKSAKDPFAPEYVVLKLPAQLPQAHAAHAGKAVFRDGAKHFFDGTATEVPAELIALLVESPASGDLGQRKLAAGEQARRDFPFDWNRDGLIDMDPIDTSWWGHCHIESALAVLSLKARSDVTLFDARSGREEAFDAGKIDNLLFALFDADHHVDARTNAAVSLDKVDFVGNRNDSVDGPRFGDKLVVETADGRTRSFLMRLTALSDAADPTKSVAIVDAFQPSKLDANGKTFSKNPAFLGLTDRDWSTIEAKGKLSATVDHLDVTTSGTIERRRENIVIDPTKPAAKPVFLGSELIRGGHPASVVEYFYNMQSGELEQRRFDPKAKPTGGYEMIASGGTKSLGKLKGMKMSRELTRESTIAFHEKAMSCIKEGRPLVVETSPGLAVWNYANGEFKIDELAREGDFVTYRMTANTQGSHVQFRYIIKYDAAGKPVDAHQLEDGMDFMFQTQRAVIAPVYRDASSRRTAINMAAHERGFLTNAEGKITRESLAFFAYATDLVFAALEKPAEKQRWVIRDAKGDLFFYADAQAFAADVAAVKGPAPAVAPAAAPAAAVA